MRWFRKALKFVWRLATFGLPLLLVALAVYFAGYYVGWRTVPILLVSSETAAATAAPSLSNTTAMRTKRPSHIPQTSASESQLGGDTGIQLASLARQLAGQRNQRANQTRVIA